MPESEIPSPSSSPESGLQGILDQRSSDCSKNCFLISYGSYATKGEALRALDASLAPGFPTDGPLTVERGIVIRPADDIWGGNGPSGVRLPGSKPGEFFIATQFMKEDVAAVGHALEEAGPLPCFKNKTFSQVVEIIMHAACAGGVRAREPFVKTAIRRYSVDHLIKEALKKTDHCVVDVAPLTHPSFACTHTKKLSVVAIRRL